MAKAKEGKKQRKWGRNALFCARYAAQNRREKNKIKRIKRHLRRFAGDKEAARSIDALTAVIRGY